jgi:hypothetical protein
VIAPDQVWVGSMTLRVGDFHIGFRSDDQGVLEILRSTYSDLQVDGTEAPFDYAIATYRNAEVRGQRPWPQLTHGRCPLLRSRDDRRMLRRLDAELATHVVTPAAGTTIVDGFAAIVGPGGAALVPAELTERSTDAEEQMRLAGVGIVDDGAIRLDPVNAEVVVLPGLLGDVPPAFADSLAVAHGRGPVRRVFWSSDGEVAGDGRAVAAAVLYQRSHSRVGLERRAMLEGLAKMADRFEREAISPADVRRVLSEVLASVR